MAPITSDCAGQGPARPVRAAADPSVDRGHGGAGETEHSNNTHAPPRAFRHAVLEEKAGPDTVCQRLQQGGGAIACRGSFPLSVPLPSMSSSHSRKSPAFP